MHSTKRGILLETVRIHHVIQGEGGIALCLLVRVKIPPAPHPWGNRVHWAFQNYLRAAVKIPVDEGN